MTGAKDASRTVICMKWGNVFAPDYVNVLYRACRANITGDFNFLCITDDDTGFLPEVMAHPIPDVGIPPERYRAGAWPKLVMFQKDLYGLQGRALFIDLDTFIFGSLDPFFELEDSFYAIGEGVSWPEKSRLNYFRSEQALREKAKTAKCGTVGSLGSGILGFTIGRHSDLLDRFLADQNAAYAKYQNEQDFICGELDRWTPWPYGMVASLKRQLRQPILLDRLLEPRSPAGVAPVLAFHGSPRPIELVLEAKSGWREFPHFWKGPVTWARDYWTRYSGSLEIET